RDGRRLHGVEEEGLPGGGADQQEGLAAGGSIDLMPIRSSDQEPETEAPERVRRSRPRARPRAVEQPAKLTRIAAMIRELLQDVRQSTPDEAGRKRLRDVYGRAVNALKGGVSAEL